jgi:hypothetical protein
MPIKPDNPSWKSFRRMLVVGLVYLFLAAAVMVVVLKLFYLMELWSK